MNTNDLLPTRRAILATSLVAAATALASGPAWTASWGVDSPVTASQRGTAQRVAQAGVPLSALAPDAPDQYTVRRGDTLWGISGKFLRTPWRWPELWGMNLNDIRNPHLIYPGQQLFLERVGDRAYLRTSRGGDGPTIRVSPRNRVEMLDASPLPTLEPGLIEPFLAEPLVVDDDTFERAPRLVAMAEKDRVLMATGDRAYARGPEDAPLLRTAGGTTDYRVFRTATPLVDPESGDILGYEGQYVGQARLVRGESQSQEPWEENVYNWPYPDSGDLSHTAEDVPADDGPVYLPVPATLDITFAKEEMRAGDRLLPEPEREYRNYVPRAPAQDVTARVVSIYGNAVRYAGSNQVVAINRGRDAGLERGDVLAVLSGGQRMADRTGGGELMQLPDERNGLAMVFQTFDRVSYVLVMGITQPVQVGDKLVNPD